MQKQESFYYQARAEAPTDTDTAAIGRAPGFGLHCLYREYTWKKKDFQVGERLIGHFLSKGCVLVLDWSLLSR